MESLLREQFGFKGGSDSLREEVMVGWPTSSLSVDINEFAAAYQEIRLRLAGLERENCSIRRKLRNYEMKFPVISVCESETSVCCSCESETVQLIQTENSNLQQRINSLVQELQSSEAHEQRLEKVIKAYEKIHLEKSSIQKELDTMTSLAEQHVERIRKLEAALGQRENVLQKKKARESSHQPLECLRTSLQSSRSLDTLTDLRVQRLEAELEGVWHEARGACQREAELKAQLQHLQEEIRQEKERQELGVQCEHCSVEWIKKAGDEQVDLALAYTELVEELSRIRSLIAEQKRILRQKRSSADQNSPVLRQGPASTPSDSTHPRPHLMRSHFQGRRSYSDMADPSVSTHVVHNPVSTLPKRRTTSHAHLRPKPTGSRPSSAHGALELSFLLPDSTPAPLATPPQSSEDEDDEWAGLRIMTAPQSHPRNEHAQSWPSIRLWMDEEESDTRSCPLCQLSFPTGFPDDALITHIDTHLENSKI
ncbi:TANK-binding kinase 1-binding protein 1-like isoform X2 [Tachysurus fulvidraco]|uniref:TANK-binding kinase 1-binding protein 1-like isoform X2 n=1 Tax=Tachysurus fulvidraco TaxID=1234273 RepID=UPI000F4FAC3B|nr:TANK-binding kinase 1-binding protein 1-like isoform X2 [Tachysurus fulvidraco]